MPQIDPNDIANPLVPEDPYRDGLVEALAALWTHLTPKQQRRLLNNKLYLYSSSFEESSFYQAACELTVCSYFARLFPTTFQYEHKVNPPKDVDCSIEHKGVRYNIEVKCADYSKKIAVDQAEGFKITSHGRLDDFLQLSQTLQDIFASGENGSQLHRMPHMDCKLLTYLQDTQAKLSEHWSIREVNVLVVCCDDAMDLLKWEGYLHGPGGLFMVNSFADPADYNHVDFVVTTNLFHRHHDVSNKNKLHGHWRLEEAFAIAYENPAACMKHRLGKELLRIFPTENRALQSHADTLENIESFLAISHFVAKKQFSNGIYKFQPPPPSSDEPSEGETAYLE